MKRSILIGTLICLSAAAIPAAQHHRPSSAAMGFDQDQTTHHFRLTATGGAIDVVARDGADQALVGQVRTHLREIVAEFARGDFAKPSVTHGEAPPGVQVMERRKANITYAFEEIATGGRVVITTSDRRARNAVHDFLRYQIREHRTGDPLTARH